MALLGSRRSPKSYFWAVKVENYLLTLRREELIELLRTAGQTVSTLKHKPPGQIRYALLALPQEILRSALRQHLMKKQRCGSPLAEKAIGITQGERTKSSVDLNNVDVAVYALYLLGGAWDPVHAENIAFKCYELAPQSFSWTKFPQYPDTETARIALMDARRSNKGSLVRGDNKRKLWVLTPAGVQRVNSIRKELEKYYGYKKHFPKPTG